MRRFYAMALAFALAWALTAPGCARPKPSQSASISASTRMLIASAQRHERERRYDLARADYERAVDQAPDRLSAAYAARKLASALLFWGEYADAERALGQVVSLRPDEASAWHDLGIVRARGGKLAAAELALRRSIALRPQLPMSRLALAALLVNQRRFGEALREYDALLAIELPGRTRAAIERAQKLLRAELASPPASDSRSQRP